MRLLALLACDDELLPGTTPTGAGPGDPTWHEDVAPLVADRCGACHRDGGIAPFSVETYAQAKPWAAAMSDAVDMGRMPPFFATDTTDCAMQVGFQDDLRLDGAERALLADWAAAGAPEGDPARAVPAPLHDPGTLPDPDVTLALPSAFEVTGTTDIYQCFRIPLDLAGDVWIDGLQVLPDNDRVVHHVLVWNDPDDLSAAEVGPDGSYPCAGDPGFYPTELVAIWAPGGSPMIAPPDAGTLVHPGASLVVNVHYHPTGDSTEVDRTEIAVRWKEAQPANHVTWYLVDLPFGSQMATGPFEIPPGEPAHVEEHTLRVPDEIPFDLSVFGLTPHMHYLGRDMLVTLEHQDGTEECLVAAPGFRFDFQTSYLYDTATGDWPVVSPGDTIRVRCTYDNSDSNPFLTQALEAQGAEAPVTVGWGEETGDEMCMAMVGLVLPPIDWLSYSF